MAKAWYQKRPVAVLLHIAVWALFFSLPYLLRPPYNQEQPHQEPYNATVSFIASRLTEIIFVSFFILMQLYLYRDLCISGNYFNTYLPSSFVLHIS